MTRAPALMTNGLPATVGRQLLLGTLIAVGAAVTGTIFALWPLKASIVIVALAAATALAMARPWMLLVFAAAVCCLLPFEALTSPSWIRWAPLSIIPLGVLLVRTHPVGSRPLWTLALAGAGVLWILASLVLAPHHGALTTIRSGVWGMTLAIAVFAPLVARRSIERSDAAELAIIGILASLAVGALLEAFVLHANPVFDSLYQSGMSPITQKWSGYRATTSLGHPLVNGLAFSTGLVLVLGRLLGETRYRSLLLAAAVALAGGIIATQSRGAMAAAVVGVGLLMLSSQHSVKGHRRKLMVAAVAAVTVLLAGSVLAGRLSSAEAQRSTDARSALPSLVAETMTHTGVTGAGPGLAGDTIDRTGAETDLGGHVLESGVAELIVGLGWPGAVLVISALAAICLRGLRDAATAAPAAAAATLFVAAAGFNAFEGHTKVIGLLGVLLLLASCPRSSETLADDTADADDTAMVVDAPVGRPRAAARLFS